MSDSRRERAEAIRRVRDLCNEHIARGRVYITVAEVLDLLDPDGHHDGRWSEPSEPATSDPQEPESHPDADPITGCLPVSYPGL